MTALTGPEERFQEFLSTYSSVIDGQKYRKRLGQLSNLNQRYVIIDFEDLVEYDSELAKLIMDKPSAHIPLLERSAWAQLKMEDPVYAEQIKVVKLRFRKLPEHYPLRRVGEQHLGKLLLLDGIIVRATPVKPFLMRAGFRCRKCTSVTYVDQEGPVMREPELCGRCKSKIFEFLEDESTFINLQEMYMQERPEDLPPGQLPRALEVKAGEDLVDIARPGDRVSITGIVKTQQEKVGSSTKLRTFTLFFEANYIDVSGKELETVEISPEEEEQILEMAKDPWIHRKLLTSLAPSIYGYESIKEAILYLLFGTVTTTLPDGISLRGEVNTLLVGDPGTAKSQLLQYVAKVAPRGLYTSGRGSTAAGLTAAVVRDKSGGLALEAGALVLADKGVCSIDEIDKMKPDDRVAIHEAMEQHSYHPSFEFTLAGGRKVRIGELVDRLFKKNCNEVVLGKDCEILPLHGTDLTLITTPDFKTFTHAHVDRVSRHAAPNEFISIRYSNMRDILVTPDHPVFIFKNGVIRTVPASKVKVNDFVPGVHFVPGVQYLKLLFPTEQIDELTNGSIQRLRVNQVRKVPNKGRFRTKWAYDVTMEPTHNFVSHGLILHNTVSIAKGGIVATLNARASVLAAANPALGRYDPYKNITENISLPVTILSRFDLIFIMRDTPDPEHDEKMSDHILTLHRTKATPSVVPLTPEMLRKYISYAHRIEPVLSEDAAKVLKSFYLKMRASSGTADSPIAITPRQLEALIRLSECRARSLLRKEVTVEDAESIIKLMTFSLQAVGIDTTTGKFDIDVIMTGTPKSMRDKMQSILSIITALERETGAVEEETLYKAVAKKGDVSEEEARRLVGQLVRDGTLYAPTPNHLKHVAA